MCNEQLKADAHTNLRDINCLIGAVDDSVSELTKKLAQLRIEREGLVQRKNQNLL